MFHMHNQNFCEILASGCGHVRFHHIIHQSFWSRRRRARLLRLFVDVRLTCPTDSVHVV